MCCWQARGSDTFFGWTAIHEWDFVVTDLSYVEPVGGDLQTDRATPTRETPVFGMG